MFLNIRFPNLGISLPDFGTGITIGGFTIKYYGILIAVGFLLGLLVTQREALRTGQNPDDYLDYLLAMILPAIIGARLYYVIFSWDYYGSHPKEILAIRNGGLAIYGGIIAGIITLIIVARIKKKSFWQMADTIVMGLLVGQIIGRFGNFTNREAFGSYTDSLLAMQIPVGEASYTTAELLEETVIIEGIPYIQVHPTFLYEALWNLLVLAILFAFRKRKQFQGELFAMYLVGYGIGRAWIEGLRTDQLQLGSTGIAVSQILSGLLALAALAAIICSRRRHRNGALPETIPDSTPGNPEAEQTEVAEDNERT